MMPSFRFETVAFSAKLKSSSCSVGGTISDMASRRSRRICVNSLRSNARSR